jgi:hypothetical protein
MKNIIVCSLIIMTITSACNFSGANTPPTMTATVPPTDTATAIPPTLTSLPTQTPPASLGTIVLDFVALVCDAQWMNGGQHLVACPDVNADHSGGYAVPLDPTSEDLPAGTPVLLTIPATNGYAALFLRYPSITIHPGDRFRATLRCKSTETACDVNFGLDYYDANGKYHSPLVMWPYAAGAAPFEVDYDLSSLAGQNVDIVLALRPNNDTPQQDIGLWIAPYIYRLNP